MRRVMITVSQSNPNVTTTVSLHVIAMLTFFQTLDTSTPQPKADKQPTFSFVLSLQKGAYPENSHVASWRIK